MRPPQTKFNSDAWIPRLGDVGDGIQGASTWDYPRWSTSLFKLPKESEIHQQLIVQPDALKAGHWFWTPAEDLLLSDFLKALESNSGDPLKHFLPWVRVPKEEIPSAPRPELPPFCADKLVGNAIVHRMKTLYKELEARQEGDEEIPLIQSEIVDLSERLARLPTTKPSYNSSSFSMSSPLFARSYSTSNFVESSDDRQFFDLLVSYQHYLLQRVKSDPDSDENGALCDEITSIEERIKY